MDFGDISDIIVGAIAIGSVIWGLLIKPLVEQAKKGRKNTDLTPGRRVHTTPRPAPARRNAAQAHIREEEASFTPWPAAPGRAPRPMAVETAPAPFISGEEGIRSTVDATAGTDSELSAMTDAPTVASELLGSTADDLRRGVIWSEIMTPKFRQ